MMKISLNELKTIVQEELGVYLPLFQETQNVVNKIKKDIKLKFSETYDNFSKIKSSVVSSIENITFKVKYTYRDFYDVDYLNNVFGIENATNGYSAYIGDKFILFDINVCGVQNKIYEKELMQVVQHELEHVFQQIKSKKQIPNNMFYAKIRTDMESQDENRRKIGRLIYGCLKSEQEGFVNGLYSFCMGDNNMIPPYSYDNIEESEAGKLYVEITDIFEELQKNERMKQILKEYKWSLKKIERNIRNFLQRIARVLVKVNNDKTQQGWRI